MKNQYADAAGFIPDEASDISIRLKLLAGEIFSCQMNLEYIKNQMFLKTATGECLDSHGADRGLVRKMAQKAAGRVTFSLPAASLSAITIPAGTAVATSGGEPLIFYTDSQCKLLTGQTAVTIGCTAQQGGSRFNVQAGEISVISTPVESGLSVINQEAFSGGTDAEGDDEFRRRICDSIINVSNGSNAAYYKKLAMSVDGVYSAGVVPLARGAGTVDVYICKNSSAADSGLVSAVQNLLDEKREINTDVLVKSAQPLSVSIVAQIQVADGYSFDSVSDQCRGKIKDYINSSGIGGKILIAEIGRLIFETPGVTNYTVNSFDKTLENSRYAVAGAITIKRSTG